MEKALVNVWAEVLVALPPQQLGNWPFLLGVRCDVDAIQREGAPRFDPAKLMIRLPQARSTWTAGQLLDIVVSQIPGQNAAYVVVPNGIEITTHRQAEILRERFQR